jgi:SAM-dependent methyltransferase
MTDTDLQEFFRSGEQHVQHVLSCCRRLFGEGFQPKSVLDFGCGVGRLLIPFAREAQRVVGLDVSPSMLAEARKNCDAFGVPHAATLLSNDRIDTADEVFELVHSAITLQHIEVERGLPLIEQLVDIVAPGGAIALHLTYGRNRVAGHYGQPLFKQVVPSRTGGAVRNSLSKIGELLTTRRAADKASGHSGEDPEMHMYPYNLSQVAYILHQTGFPMFHAEFADHGGELGVTLFARRPRHGSQ